MHVDLNRDAPRVKSSIQPTVVDLFCGAGGMSLGFQMAGYHIGLGVESEERPSQTHNHNFDSRCYTGDIREIADPGGLVEQYGLRNVDIIIGGPPCQGFSRVGRGKIRNLRDDPEYVHDPRNQYYREFIRFVDILRPRYFVIENVPDMQFYADADGLLITRLGNQLRGIGYNTDYRVLQADHYGVAQTRKRLFIVGNRLGHEIVWPEKTHENTPVTVWQAISDLPIVSHGHREDEMTYKPRGDLTPYQQLMREGAGTKLFNHQTRWHNRQDLEAFTLMPEGGKYIDLPQAYKRYRDDIFKDKYRKLYRDHPSWTIEAHIGKDTYRYIYPSRPRGPEPPRTISVREAARLQSFPDFFRFRGPFTTQFSQLGNAVPPFLAKAIAQTIRPYLG